MSKYALLLNNMQSPNIENISIVKIADTKQELIDWYESQEADKGWTDGQWHKHFKKGSDLEWFNPIHNLEVENDYWGGIWVVNDNAEVGQGLYKR
jgi:hypothetical protein